MAYIGVPDDIPSISFGKNIFRIVSTVLVIEESLNFRKGNLFEFLYVKNNAFGCFTFFFLSARREVTQFTFLK